MDKGGNVWPVQFEINKFIQRNKLFGSQIRIVLSELKSNKEAQYEVEFQLRRLVTIKANVGCVGVHVKPSVFALIHLGGSQRYVCDLFIVVQYDILNMLFYVDCC